MEEQHTRTLRVAVVGLGWFAMRAHIPALRKIERSDLLPGVRVEVSLVCTRNARAHAKVQQQLGHMVRCVETLEDVLSDHSVDVVDLVVPIYAMASAIEEALKAGKHVLSEKPGACSFVLAQRLWAEYSSQHHNPRAWYVSHQCNLISKCIPSRLKKHERIPFRSCVVMMLGY